MQPISILLPQDPQRGQAERLISQVFWSRYNARITNYPETLAVMYSPEGAPVCAAGLRFSRDGFFSEQYLQRPIENILASAFGGQVVRHEVFEVTSLASLDHYQTVAFIRGIIRYGQAAGLEFSFFTLTGRLRQMLSRIGIRATYLADAEACRVVNAGDWGTYYNHSPAVFALRNPEHFPPAFVATGSTHAISL